MRQLQSTLINPTGELPSSPNAMEANVALEAKEGFPLTDVDEQRGHHPLEALTRP